jgi:short-subunit dehydrogenase
MLKKHSYYWEDFMSATTTQRFAIVTGASSGIGLELARRLAEEGYDLLIAADLPAIEEAGQELTQRGVSCRALQCDLSTRDGVEQLIQAAEEVGRPVDALVANAGIGLGHAFLDQNLEEALKVVHTNVDGTLILLHGLGKKMRSQGRGRILITGSIAGLMPGTFEAVYNGTKAFLDSFSVALSNELKDSGVTVTCLMPGPTETDFFKRGDMSDTKVGSGEKQSAADVAKIGYEAMMSGELEVVAGLKNKFQAAMAHIMPDSILAKMHRGMSEPGTGQQEIPKSERERTDQPQPH